MNGRFSVQKNVVIQILNSKTVTNLLCCDNFSNSNILNTFMAYVMLKFLSLWFYAIALSAKKFFIQ